MTHKLNYILPATTVAITRISIRIRYLKSCCHAYTVGSTT